MRRLVVVISAVCCIGALGLAGCGSSSGSSPTSVASTASSGASTTGSASGTKSLATAKFLLHAGLAFGAFHHFIYNPVKAGALKNPGSHKLTLAKAGLAGLFVYHEVKLAAANAKSSKLLSPLVAPLTALGDKLKSLKTSITSGSASSSDIDSLNSQVDQIKSTAAAKGQSIKESVPSTMQLATGG